VAVRLTAPSEPGEYVAEIDLVHEFVAWFASKGLERSAVVFHVSDRGSDDR
jgi:hypothetical protein